jgi:hypothetical protein
MFNRTSLALALVAFGATTFTVGAMAETPWQHAHPRRAEVNARLDHQKRRIHNEVQSGEISKRQAATLHKEDRQIRREEHAMARQDGGHITKLDQRALNQQENGVSAQIGK